MPSLLKDGENREKVAERGRVEKEKKKKERGL